MDHPEKRLEQLAEAIITAYVLLTTTLATMPLPIRLPEPDDDWDAPTALQAVERARSELIAAQPLPELTIRLTDRMILNWLNAYELGALMKVAGITNWRLDGAEQELSDLLRISEVVDRMIAQENPSDE